MLLKALVLSKIILREETERRGEGKREGRKKERQDGSRSGVKVPQTLKVGRGGRAT